MMQGFRPIQREKRVFEVEDEYLVIILGRARKFRMEDIEKVKLFVRPVYARPQLFIKKSTKYVGGMTMDTKEGAHKPHFQTFRFATYVEGSRRIDSSFEAVVRNIIKKLEKRLRKYRIPIEMDLKK